MNISSNINTINKNQIKIFRYVLTNKEIENTLLSKEISVKSFVENILIKLFDFIIAKVKKEESNHDFCSDDCIFSKDELFSFARTLKKSLFIFMRTDKVDDYAFRKYMDEAFDDLYFYIWKVENQEEQKDSSNTLQVEHLLNILNVNLPLLQISKEGKILQINEAFKELFLFESNSNFENIKDIFLHKKNHDNFLEKLNTNKSYNEEVKLTKFDDTTFWADISIYKGIDLKSDVLAIIFKDISYKKSLEKQKKIFLEQSKMATMGELISMIAHQWRQPLQTVSILSQKLVLTKSIDGCVDNDILEKSVKDIDSQLNYMSKTIDDFRNFFKPEAKKAIVKPSAMINKALMFLHYMITMNDIDVKIDIVKDNEITVLENNIIQVFINLIKNSIDIFIERKIEKKELSIRCDFNESYVIIHIEDNAGGIPVDIIDKIFESYFTTKDSKNGTGLGLYMSKTIIEEHSMGKLSVQNSEIGALFEIQLPIE